VPPEEPRTEDDVGAPLDDQRRIGNSSGEYFRSASWRRRCRQSPPRGAETCDRRRTEAAAGVRG